jgi:ribosomal protein L18E
MAKSRKAKSTNNDLQDTTRKTKDWARQTPTNIWKKLVWPK